MCVCVVNNPEKADGLVRMFLDVATVWTLLSKQLDLNRRRLFEGSTQ